MTLRLPIQEYHVSHLFTSSFITVKKMSFPSGRPCIDMSKSLVICFLVWCCLGDVSDLLANVDQLFWFLSQKGCRLLSSSQLLFHFCPITYYPFILDALRGTFNISQPSIGLSQGPLFLLWPLLYIPFSLSTNFLFF